mmetsp:Transcript_28348/g.28642  ORF Transcript_28348/g.28642 Transcript_28348/m.28642 type:complete len:82 (+) Transcript_28348:59-304(+)
MKMKASLKQNLYTGTWVVAGAFIMFSTPFLLRYGMSNKREKTSSLSGSQTQRGMFMNYGARDVGMDPDWDPETQTWKGRRN